MVIQEFASAKKQQNKGKKNNDIYSGAFYLLGGVVSGFIYDELWHRFNLPTEKITESVITHQPIQNINGVSLDKFTLTLISGLLALSELFLNVKGGSSSGAGMMMGYSFANSFRNQKYLGQL